MKAVRYGIDTMDDFHKLERMAISHIRTSSNSKESILPCGGVLKSVAEHWGDVDEYTLDCPLMSGSSFKTMEERERDRQLIELSEKLDTMSKEEMAEQLDAMYFSK